MAKRFDVLTIFPGIFGAVFGAGVIGRAAERGLVEVHAHDLRDFTHDRHRQVDDSPFGGGAGMVLKPEPIFEAVEQVRRSNPGPLILMEPWGERLTQELAAELAASPGWCRGWSATPAPSTRTRSPPSSAAFPSSPDRRSTGA